MNITNNKEALIYFKKLGHELKYDAELLKTYLGIYEFGYLKLFYNNTYFYLSSDQKMIHDFVTWVDDAIIFYDKLLLSNNGYDVILWPDYCVNYAMELYKKHNHWNGVSFLKKNKDYVEIYRFTSTLHSPLSNDFYIRNNKALILFIEYWVDKNREILKLDCPKRLATFVNGVDFSNIDKIELDKEL